MATEQQKALANSFSRSLDPEGANAEILRKRAVDAGYSISSDPREMPKDQDYNNHESALKKSFGVGVDGPITNAQIEDQLGGLIVENGPESWGGAASKAWRKFWPSSNRTAQQTMDEQFDASLPILLSQLAGAPGIISGIRDWTIGLLPDLNPGFRGIVWWDTPGVGAHPATSEWPAEPRYSEGTIQIGSEESPTLVPGTGMHVSGEQSWFGFTGRPSETSMTVSPEFAEQVLDTVRSESDQWSSYPNPKDHAGQVAFSMLGENGNWRLGNKQDGRWTTISRFDEESGWYELLNGTELQDASEEVSNLVAQLKRFGVKWNDFDYQMSELFPQMVIAYGRDQGNRGLDYEKEQYVDAQIGKVYRNRAGELMMSVKLVTEDDGGAQYFMDPTTWDMFGQPKGDSGAFGNFVSNVFAWSGYTASENTVEVPVSYIVKGARSLPSFIESEGQQGGRGSGLDEYNTAYQDNKWAQQARISPNPVPGLDRYLFRLGRMGVLSPAQVFDMLPFVAKGSGIATTAAVLGVDIPDEPDEPPSLPEGDR